MLRVVRSILAPRGHSRAVSSVLCIIASRIDQAVESLYVTSPPISMQDTVADRRPNEALMRDNPTYSAHKRSLRPSTPEDGPAIVALMREAGLEPDANPVNLEWKYWRPRADWSGPRSFVVVEGGELLAHGALMPGTLRWKNGEARVIHMIDWAARRQAIGVGVQLMKYVGRQTDFLLAIGGSEHTRKIMPLLGYRPCGEVTGFVRPFALMRRTRRLRGAPWRRLPRLARSALWSFTAPQVNCGLWQSRPIVAEMLGQIEALIPQPSGELAVLGRSTEFLRHALACPIVPLELHLFEQAGRTAGYFLLSYAPGQARLADLWLDSADPADWRALVQLALRTAQRHSEPMELAAWSSDPALSQVLRECGFHARFTLPIYLLGSGEARVPGYSIRAQMLDNDAFYLYSGDEELWA